MDNLIGKSKQYFNDWAAYNFYSYLDKIKDLRDFLNNRGIVINNKLYTSKLKEELGFTNQELVKIIECFENYYNIVIPDLELLDKILFENFDPTFKFIFNIIDKKVMNKLTP